MVQVKTACVLLVLLCAALPSTARLHPGDHEVNAISTLKASSATTCAETRKAKREGAKDNGNSKNMGVKLEVVRNYNGIKAKSSSNSNIERKRSKSRRLFDEVVDKGFVAFSADYHAPRHHPPKNN